jgi:succinate dehydrogenase / fumarate reductase membrane anchor subunit
MENATLNGQPIEAGSRHWTLQHQLSVATLLLGSWFAVSLALMPDFEIRTIVDWLSGTVPFLALVLLVVSLFWHAKLGLQVLVEDYVHDAGSKFAAMVVVNFAVIAGLAAALTFLLRITAYTIAVEMVSQQASMSGMQ